MIQAHLRKFAATVAVGLAVIVGGSAFAAQSNSELGTWKMDPAKSQTNNKGVTNTIEAAGEGVKVIVEVLRTDGSVTKYSYVANFDGKYNKIDGQSASGDEVAAIRVDAHTVRYDFKRAGKPSSARGCPYGSL